MQRRFLLVIFPAFFIVGFFLFIHSTFAQPRYHLPNPTYLTLRNVTANREFGNTGTGVRGALEASPRDTLLFKWAKVEGAQAYWYSSDLTEDSRNRGIYLWNKLDTPKAQDRGTYYTLEMPASTFPEGTHWFQITACPLNGQGCSKSREGYDYLYVWVRVKGIQPLASVSLNINKESVRNDEPLSLEWRAQNARAGFIQVDFNSDGVFDYEENVIDRSKADRQWSGSTAVGSLTYLKGISGAWRAQAPPDSANELRIRYKACDEAQRCNISGWKNIFGSTAPRVTMTFGIEGEAPLTFTGTGNPFTDAIAGLSVTVERPLGARLTLFWNAQNADQCAGYGEWANDPIWRQENTRSGRLQVSVLRTPQEFVLTCRRSMPIDSKILTINLGAGFPPELRISSTGFMFGNIPSEYPISIPGRPGAEIVFIWSASRADSCNVSGALQGEWDRDLDREHQLTTSFTENSRTFTIECQNHSGSVRQTAILEPVYPPLVEFEIGGERVEFQGSDYSFSATVERSSGSQINLSWNVTQESREHLYGCRIVGGFTGEILERSRFGYSNGLARLYFTEGPQNFVLACRGTGGESVYTLELRPFQQPILNFRVEGADANDFILARNPTSGNRGRELRRSLNTEINLLWNAGNVQSCSGLGAWANESFWSLRGTPNVNGRFRTTFQPLPQSFTLECRGPAGPLSDTIILRSLAPLPMPTAEPTAASLIPSPERQQPLASEELRPEETNIEANINNVIISIIGELDHVAFSQGQLPVINSRFDFRVFNLPPLSIIQDISFETRLFRWPREAAGAPLFSRSSSFDYDPRENRFQGTTHAISIPVRTSYIEPGNYVVVTTFRISREEIRRRIQPDYGGGDLNFEPQRMFSVGPPQQYIEPPEMPIPPPSPIADLEPTADATLIIYPPEVRDKIIGQEFQFELIYDSDGENGPMPAVPVHNYANWSVEPSNIASVRRGLVTGSNFGEANVIAFYKGLSATAVYEVYDWAYIDIRLNDSSNPGPSQGTAANLSWFLWNVEPNSCTSTAWPSGLAIPQTREDIFANEGQYLVEGLTPGMYSFNLTCRILNSPQTIFDIVSIDIIRPDRRIIFLEPSRNILFPTKRIIIK